MTAYVERNVVGLSLRLTRLLSDLIPLTQLLHLYFVQYRTMLVLGLVPCPFTLRRWIPYLAG